MLITDVSVMCEQTNRFPFNRDEPVWTNSSYKPEPAPSLLVILQGLRQSAALRVGSCDQHTSPMITISNAWLGSR